MDKILSAKKDLDYFRARMYDDSMIEEVFSIYEPMGYDIIFTSALEKLGIEDFQEMMEGKISVSSYRVSGISIFFAFWYSYTTRRKISREIGYFKNGRWSRLRLPYRNLLFG